MWSPIGDSVAKFDKHIVFVVCYEAGGIWNVKYIHLNLEIFHSLEIFVASVAYCLLNKTLYFHEAFSIK